jgi:arabinan endo-1,5-alpha-L-arabinosidase
LLVREMLRGLVVVSMLAWGAGAQAPQSLGLTGDVAATHDPSMAREGKTYHVFATGKAPDGGELPIRCSEDLHAWRLCGHVFDAMPAWIVQRSPKTKELWAPDISYSHGVYRLYYSYSVFGLNTSGIALATNKTLDRTSAEYKWVDEGTVLESVRSDNFNAIDPNYVEDGKGGAWLAFGSFWSGIKMRALDAATGKLSGRDATVYPLAARGKGVSEVRTAAPDAASALPPDSEAVEAPFVFRHGGFFYLFVSYDLCCRGVHSTYRTMVGRAARVNGPYVDEQGRPMGQGNATQVLFNTNEWVGPGGQSLFRDKDGKDFIVFHAYDATTGKSSLQISPVVWKEGWPRAGL